MQKHSIFDQDRHKSHPPLKLVLAGNPNVGKSIFFNYLTGIYADVSNFPGTTVDLSIGYFDKYTVIDTPGVYGISSFNDEECVTRDAVIHADLILNIVDAVHIERDLFLTQQIIDMGKPLILVLNMMDEAEKYGIEIDAEALSEILGVLVIPASAVKGMGFSQIKNAVLKGGTIGNRIPEIRYYMNNARQFVTNDAEAILLLEEDESIIKRYKSDKRYCCREFFYNIRRNYVNKIVSVVQYKSNIKSPLLSSFGNLMLKPVAGIPILIFILFLLYELIGKVIAQHIVGITEDIIMGTYYYNFIIHITSNILDSATLTGRLLIGEFGILTMVPIYIAGLLLPLVISFYLFMSILEDSGLLPRIAVLTDRLLNIIGLNGKAVIPLILGFGCVTMAIMTTRILGSKRERFIATMLLSVAVPCSAQLGVIMGIAAALSPELMSIYAACIFLIFIILGILLERLLPGKSSDLLIDIPPIRIPQLKNILRKTASKSKMFLSEAGPLFFLGAVIITILQYTEILPLISDAFSPVTVHLLQLPKEVTNIFIMGIIRRDFGAAGLNSIVSEGFLTPPQAVVALIVITLFVPCIASIMIIFKERKLFQALMIWLNSFIIAFIAGGIVSHILIN